MHNTYNTKTSINDKKITNCDARMVGRFGRISSQL